MRHQPTAVHSPRHQHSREYSAWVMMRSRCRNPNMREYPRYGGRGVKVCERWESFEAFLADMGAAPSPLHTLDRIDNDKDYCPDNCRWATRKEQARNRYVSRILECGGERRCLCDWAEHLGIPHQTIWHRLRRGWSVERALNNYHTSNVVKEACEKVASAVTLRPALAQGYLPFTSGGLHKPRVTGSNPVAATDDGQTTYDVLTMDGDVAS